MSRYPNKRKMFRKANGRFRAAVMEDVGIGGACPTCRHFLLRHYDGDPRNPFVDPRLFRYRCFTCEPETDAELALKAEIEAARPKRPSIMDILSATETEGR